MDAEPAFEKFDPSLPDYINFLLCEEVSKQLDLQVNVGPDELEQVGAVKWMLIAQSKVLRVMLLRSKIKQLQTYDVTDLEPKTFKQFLTYIYGHDHMDKLPFEDGVKLLSAAEKYEVQGLKSRLADTLTPQVTVENVPAILDNGAVCETVPPLWEETTKVIQTETKYLLESPRFLSLKPPAVVHILQQDALNVDEIDVWRASLRWARHQLSDAAGSVTVSADTMRSTMLPLLQHTRLCTLNYEQLCKEVIPSRVVTFEEIQMICSSVANGVKESGLTTICNEIEPRNKEAEVIIQVDISSLSPPMVLEHDLSFSKYVIKAKKRVNLMAFEFIPNSQITNGTYQCRVKVDIIRVTDHSHNTSSETPSVFELDEVVPYGQPVEMPLEDEAGRKLTAGDSYIVDVEMSSHSMWRDKSIKSHQLTSNNDLTLTAVEDLRGIGRARNVLKGLTYTVG